MKYQIEEARSWKRKYESGKNVPTIANEIGVPEQTIYGYLRVLRMRENPASG